MKILNPLGLVVCASALFILLITGSCKKENNNNNNTCSTFFPLKTGDNWSYINGSTSLGTLTVGNDTVINGLTYSIINRSDTANYYVGRLFVRNSNGQIFGYLTDPFDLFSDNYSSGEQLFLKDSAVVGDSWLAVNGTTRTVIETGLTMTVGGKSFTNVKHVRETITLSFAPYSETRDYFFAECVGLISVSGNSIATYRIY
jgi:hypothetical protein